MRERYFLLDEGACGDDDLPRRNLLSAVTALEDSHGADLIERAGRVKGRGIHL